MTTVNGVTEAVAERNAAVQSETKRLSYAELQAKLSQVDEKKSAPKVHGSISIAADEVTGEPVFLMVVPLKGLTTEHAAWKEGTFIRNGKPVTSLNAMLTLAADVPTGCTVPISTPEGIKHFRVKPNGQFGATRFINLSLDPVPVATE